MKAKIDAILKREQAEYLDRLLPKSDDLLAEMEQYAAEHRVPIAEHELFARSVAWIVSSLTTN